MQPFDREMLGSLAEKMLRGTITPAEQDQLDEWLAEIENKEVVNSIPESTEEEFKSRLLNGIKQEAGLSRNDKEEKIIRYRWQIAASLLFILGFSAWFYFYNNKNTSAPLATVQPDIAPGKEGAVLTLSDGRKILLDSSGNMPIATQGGAHVINSSGTLKYQNAEALKGAPVVYNTLFTPKRRQYKLILPDSTVVWLNAESVIRYPVTFTKQERVVEITGEAYFEVMHNAARPFHVKVGKTDVCVLGTHFNINAYGDEAGIRTTLLQGSVKVTDGSTERYLEPGQQSVVDTAAGTIRITSADTEAAVAWKSGFFQFDGTSLAVMLRQLSRWYGITVRYEGAIPEMRFGGKLKRSLPLSGVLKLLKEGGIQYTLQGNQLSISSDNP